MDKGLFLFFLFFWITAQLLCNFVDGSNMLTDANVADIGSMSTSSTTTSVDTTGTPATYVAMGTDFFETINKLVFFDYTLFRDLDGTANDFIIFRYLLIAIGLVVLISAAIVFRSIFVG